MPGKASKEARKHISPGRLGVYEAIKGRLGKRSAARIANAGASRSGRSRMARKAARTRRQRG